MTALIYYFIELNDVWKFHSKPSLKKFLQLDEVYVHNPSLFDHFSIILGRLSHFLCLRCEDFESLEFCGFKCELAQCSESVFHSIQPVDSQAKQIVAAMYLHSFMSLEKFVEFLSEQKYDNDNIGYRLLNVCCFLFNEENQYLLFYDYDPAVAHEKRNMLQDWFHVQLTGVFLYNVCLYIVMQMAKMSKVPNINLKASTITTIKMITIFINC